MIILYGGGGGGVLDNSLETKYQVLSYPYKFMNGYLYFPNNLKNIKKHIKLQNLFPITGNNFQRKPKLIVAFLILQ